MILKAPASRHSNDEGARRAAAEGPSSRFVSAGDALQREAVRLEMEDQLVTPHQTRHAMHRPNHPANRCQHRAPVPRRAATSDETANAAPADDMRSVRRAPADVLQSREAHRVARLVEGCN